MKGMSMSLIMKVSESLMQYHSHHAVESYWGPNYPRLLSIKQKQCVDLSLLSFTNYLTVILCTCQIVGNAVSMTESGLVADPDDFSSWLERRQRQQILMLLVNGCHQRTQAVKVLGDPPDNQLLVVVQCSLTFLEHCFCEPQRPVISSVDDSHCDWFSTGAVGNLKWLETFANGSVAI